MKIRSTNRVYINQALTNSTLKLDGDIAHYIINVLRCKVNDKLRVFNNLSGEFVANIHALSKKDLHLQIEKFLRPVIPSPKLVLAASIIKNDKMADMVSMAVQIGVTEIIPLISDHTINRNFKQDRFEKIAIEATEQSERCEVPRIRLPTLLKELVSNNEFDYIIYANEHEVADRKLDSSIAKQENIVLILGPEGGFSQEELSFFSKSNAISVSLGTNILRAETAAVKLLSYIQFLRGI